MRKNNAVGKWVQEDDEEEEALSLCDLPINDEDKNQSRKESSKAIKIIKTEDDDHFDFCSMLTESEMCSADELFFQGQILPLRHSISTESSLAALRSHSHRHSHSHISRSASMEDHYNYSSGFTSGSSRSSSIRSHQSSSSSSGNNSSKNTSIINHFYHSHPSPKPQIKSSNNRKQNVANSNQKPTMWTHFRLGLLTPPEIALQDLKVRSNNHSSSSSTRIKSDKKTKHALFDKNGVLFGGCKCSVNAVETMSSSRVVTIKRHGSIKEAYSHEEEIKGTTRKQTLSRHRTFEWLKQLSLEGVISAADQ